MKYFRIAVFATLTATSGVAMAATQGTTGGTSTGSSVLTVTKSAEVQISGIEDITFSDAGFIGAGVVGSSDLCVYSSGGSYTINASSSQAQYSLTDGASGQINYSVTWEANGGGAVSLAHNTASAAFTGSQAGPTCGGSENVTMVVTLDPNTFNSAVAGDYSDTLTLLVAPI